MQQTETYKLNLIESSDPFLPDALNENTRKIEEVVDGLEQRVQGRPLPDVQLVEPGLGVDGGLEAGLEVVGHHHVPAGVDELVHGVGADVAGPAQHQNCHKECLPVVC